MVVGASHYRVPAYAVGAIKLGLRVGTSMTSYVKGDMGLGLVRALGRVLPGNSAPRLDGGAERHARGVVPDMEPATGAMSEQKARAKDLSRSLHEGLELWPLPGLAPMTRVRTTFGDVHSIALRKGDKVLLKTGEYKAIEWINRIMLDEHILNLKPDCNPILLAPGSLGPGVPSNEMMVSPRQIFCADDRSGLSKDREAAMLLSRTGIRKFRETGLTYTMFHVGEAADVYCEGAYLRFPTET